ncbi:transcriptional regulator [Paradevosia shaoguanensis]|uniref:Transcriptional regulator n=1 Tax=Paradevosia shaoguanensis TaxID=1335043 RepID=A0AA41QQG1_9HYPH|nr:transcriptional regulator [Paradevosia shaoguanensis]MCF1744652.1 transcriptional regulator [Paradevosia shaoguanensis]MCI0129135.1 transcriptional regulator [Paradevosia shaoguanensis]
MSPAEPMTMVEKANRAHGNAMPEWIGELARLVDASGLKEAARRLGYSTATLSQVCNGKYLGDLAKVGEVVRGALMAETVDCPVLGEIGRDRCLHEQDEPFRATSSYRAQLYQACRHSCPHSRIKGAKS